MSEIFVDTIKNKAGSTSLDSDKLPDMYTGSAKMFVNFYGTGTPTARKSFNLSSITDNGTGHYRLTFTNAFADNDFASPSSAADSSGNNPRIALAHADDDAATTYYDIKIKNDAGSATDAEHIHTATFGDLA